MTNFEQQWHNKIARKEPGCPPEYFGLKIKEALRNLEDMNPDSKRYTRYLAYIGRLVVGAANHEGYTLTIHHDK